ncbi:metalloregulator ArsR/SmtB family transcription factor [Alteromonas sp. MTD1]|uniref:ArsR/SmtB family transcription factor n=1 Tax=Alteromonas sp. MTD1 TaxID=3057962 RepID=UPI0036F266EE
MSKHDTDDDSNPVHHPHKTLRDALTESNDTFERGALLLKVFADAERLKLLSVLYKGEACMSELATQVQMSRVSQRLKILKNENLVKTRREGKHIIYSLADNHVYHLMKDAIDHVKEKL